MGDFFLQNYEKKGMVGVEGRGRILQMVGAFAFEIQRGLGNNPDIRRERVPNKKVEG
jgi:hypothetical protein